MKDLIIVGAGGFGREAYYTAKTIGTWNIKVFIETFLFILIPIKTIMNGKNSYLQVKLIP